MFRKLTFVLAIIALPVILAACGGDDSGSTSSSAEATFEAALDDAEQTPVTDDMREYTLQLCDPMATFLADASDTITKVEAAATERPTPEDLDEAFDAFVDLFAEFNEPMRALRDDLKTVDPPESLAEYHESFTREVERFLEAFSILEEDGFGAFLTLPTDIPSIEEPPGFEAALLQECGNELKDLVGQLGEDFFGDGFFGGGTEDIIPID